MSVFIIAQDEKDGFTSPASAPAQHEREWWTAGLWGSEIQRRAADAEAGEILSLCLKYFASKWVESLHFGYVCTNTIAPEEWYGLHFQVSRGVMGV